MIRVKFIGILFHRVLPCTRYNITLPFFFTSIYNILSVISVKYLQINAHVIHDIRTFYCYSCFINSEFEIVAHRNWFYFKTELDLDNLSKQMSRFVRS